jgi:hypothetical protein
MFITQLLFLKYYVSKTNQLSRNFFKKLINNAFTCWICFLFIFVKIKNFQIKKLKKFNSSIVLNKA